MVQREYPAVGLVRRRPGWHVGLTRRYRLSSEGIFISTVSRPAHTPLCISATDLGPAGRWRSDPQIHLIEGVANRAPASFDVVKVPILADVVRDGKGTAVDILYSVEDLFDLVSGLFGPRFSVLRSCANRRRRGLTALLPAGGQDTGPTRPLRGSNDLLPIGRAGIRSDEVKSGMATCMRANALPR